MTERNFKDLFANGVLDPRLSWHCEPSEWSFDGGLERLVLRTREGTDFWQRTHYGFQADNGHFLFLDCMGDFVLAAHVRSYPAHLYDQAGLMIRKSDRCWLKTSVEYIPGAPSLLGAVVTNNGYSDWSTQEFPAGPNDVWLRVRREGSDYTVEFSHDGLQWKPIRLAHLQEDTDGGPIQCGIYACSPKGSGFAAEFTAMSLELIAV